ncbi:MAG: HAMP domain-containing sensor histidine kinase [Chloroflexota bacterium]
MIRQIFSNSLRLKLMTAYGLLSVFAILCVYAMVWIILFMGGSVLYNIQRLNKVEEALIAHLEAGGELNEFNEFFVREVIQGPVAAIPQPRPPIIIDGEVVRPERPLRPTPSLAGDQANLGPPPPRPRAALNDTSSFGVVDLKRRVVQSFAGNRYGDVVPDDYEGTIHPVTIDGELVAYIYTGSRFDWIVGPEGVSGRVMSSALLVLSRSFPISLVLGALSAIGIGWIWASLLIAPIVRLRDAAAEVSSGSLGGILPVKTQDEMGRLTSSFNQMSTALANATKAKKQLTMEIATTLNSPMDATFQMIQEIRADKSQMTPLQLRKIVRELNQMDQLIEDLNLLSQIDTNRLELNIQTIDARSFLEELAEEFETNETDQALVVDFEPSDRFYSIQTDRSFLKHALIKLLRSAFMQTESGDQVALTVGLNSEGFVTLFIRLIGFSKDGGNAPDLNDNDGQSNLDKKGDSNSNELGLTISEELIGALGGTIRIASQLGNQQNFFDIALPAGQTT